MAGAQPSRTAPLLVLHGSHAGEIAEFVRALPRSPAMAVLVITPDATAGELPARLRRLPGLVRARSGMIPRAGRCYYAPRGSRLRLMQRRLALVAARGGAAPCDDLLLSLRHEARRTVAVVLDITAGDGLLGLTEIQAAGGIGLAATECGNAWAPYPGLAPPDAQLPVGLLAARAAELAAHPYFAGEAPPSPPPPGEDCPYAPAYVGLRLQRRMALRGVHAKREYQMLLERDAAEAELLQRDLHLGAGPWAGGAPPWNWLRREVLRRAARHPHEPLRLWICEAGVGGVPHAWIASLLEWLRKERNGHSLRLIATTGDANALRAWREARYPPSLAARVPAAAMRRYFAPHPLGGFHAALEMREQCLCADHRLGHDPPFSNFDLVISGIGMARLAPARLEAAWRDVYDALREPGFFHGEGLAAAPAPFAAWRGGWRRKLPGAARRAWDEPMPGVPDPAAAIAELARLADRALLARYAPPALLLNAQWEIVDARGAVERYMTPPAGAAGGNVLRWARGGLGSVLRVTLEAAQERKTAVLGESVPAPEGEHRVRPWAMPLSAPGTQTSGMLVALESEAASARHATALRGQSAAAPPAAFSVARSWRGTADLTRDLASAQFEIEAIRFELGLARDQLDAAQSDLERQMRDFRAALECGWIAVLMLDRELRIRLMSPLAARLLALLPSDLGRPITDLRPGGEFREWASWMEATLASGTPEIKMVPGGGGTLLRLRICPWPNVPPHGGLILVLESCDTQPASAGRP